VTQGEFSTTALSRTNGSLHRTRNMFTCPNQTLERSVPPQEVLPLDGRRLVQLSREETMQTMAYPSVSRTVYIQYPSLCRQSVRQNPDQPLSNQTLPNQSPPIYFFYL